MTSLRTSSITTSTTFILLWSHVILENRYRCELHRETTPTIYILYIWIILHANNRYSSAVPPTLYHRAEHERTFFKHGTAPDTIISQIKIWISFEEKWELMSARWDTVNE